MGSPEKRFNYRALIPLGRAIFPVRPLRISPVGSKASLTVQVLFHVNCSSSRCGSKSSYWQFWFKCPVIIALKHGAYCVPIRLDVHHYLLGRVETLSVDYRAGNDCWAFVAPSFVCEQIMIGRSRAPIKYFIYHHKFLFFET